MAITVTNKGSGSATSGTGPYTATLLSAPTANRVQLAFVVNSVNSGGPPVQPALTSTGLTWVPIATVNFGTISTQLRRLTAYRAYGAAPSGTTVTVTAAGMTGAAWTFCELTGVDDTGVAGANAIADVTVSAVDGGTTLTSLNLGGIVFNGDAVIAGFGLDTASLVTPAEGFTEISEATFSSPTGRVQSQYHLTYDTTPTATWTSSNSAGIALELKLIENAFKSNPKPGELITLSDALPAAPQLITAPLVIPPCSDTVTLSEAAPDVEIWQSEWYGATNLLNMPQTAETVTISEDAPDLILISANILEIPGAAESVTVSDAATVTGLILPIPVADLLSVGDQPPIFTLSGGGVWAINVPDTVSLSETLTPNLISQPQCADSVTLTEARTANVLNQPIAADSTTLSEARTVQILLQPTAAESTTLSDARTVMGLTLPIPVAESLTVSDIPFVSQVGVIPVDNFDDNTQNPGIWLVATIAGAGDALVLVNETSHQLHVTPGTSASGFAYNGYISADAFNVTNTGVFAEVVQVAGVATTAQTSLILAIDGTNYYSIVQEGGLLFLQDTVGGITNGTNIAYSASTHRWWRLRHVSADNTIHWETSPSGTPGSWTDRRTPLTAVLSVTAMRIALEAGTYTPVATPGVAIFDNFNTTTLTAFPADALTLTDAPVIHLRHHIRAADSVTVTETRTVQFRLASSLVDTFDDNTHDTTLWTKEATDDPTITDALVTVVEAGQQLSITPRSLQTGLRYNGYRSAQVYDLTNNAFFVKVEQVASGATADTQLIAALDAANWYMIYHESGQLVFADSVAGTPNFSNFIPYNASMHRWWRIRHSLTGDPIRFDTSADGINWTQRHSLPTAFMVTALRLGIEAGTYQSVTTPGVAIFDSFNTEGVGSIIAIDDPADSLTLSDASEAETVSPMSDTVFVTDDADVGLWTSVWYGTVNLLAMPHSADSVTLSDTALFPVVQIHEPNVGDLVTLSDAALFPSTRLIPVGSSVTLTDTLTVTGLTLQASRAESVTLSETQTTNLVVAPKGSDSLSPTDGVTTRLFVQPQPSESLTLSDGVLIIGLVLKPSAADSLTLTDSGAPSFSVIIARADSVTLTDTPTVRGLLSKMTVADSVGLSDQGFVFAGMKYRETVTLSDTVNIFVIGGIVTQPTVVIEGELRDLTKVVEVSLAAVTVNLRDLTHEAATRLTSVTADVRDLTKEVEVSLAQVVADVRDLFKVA